MIEFGQVEDTTTPDSIFRVKFRKYQLSNTLRHVVAHRLSVALPIHQRNRAILIAAWSSNGMKEVIHAPATGSLRRSYSSRVRDPR